MNLITAVVDCFLLSPSLCLSCNDERKLKDHGNKKEKRHAKNPNWNFHFIHFLKNIRIKLCIFCHYFFSNYKYLLWLISPYQYLSRSISFTRCFTNWWGWNASGHATIFKNKNLEILMSSDYFNLEKRMPETLVTVFLY